MHSGEMITSYLALHRRLLQLALIRGAIAQSWRLWNLQLPETLRFTIISLYILRRGKSILCSIKTRKVKLLKMMMVQRLGRHQIYKEETTYIPSSLLRCRNNNFQGRKRVMPLLLYRTMTPCCLVAAWGLLLGDPRSSRG